MKKKEEPEKTEKLLAETTQASRNGKPGLAEEIYSAPKPPRKGRIIGVDCHPDTYAAAVFRGRTPHDARKICTREKLNLDAFLEWAGKEFNRHDLFLMEAGSNSFEIHRRLLALGLRAVVLESAYVGKHAKTYADNDKMAAARIVLVYLGGTAPCVWVPERKVCERRELLHAYRKAVVDHTAAVNSIKSYLNQFTVRLQNRGLHLERTRTWILHQRAWSDLQQQLLADYFSEFDHQTGRRKLLTRLIAQQVSTEPLMLRCMKLLGIGMINAFALLAVIGDVRRFERPEKLVAYIGLNPGQRVSGGNKRIKVGVGTRGRGDMRHLLIQGAQAVLRMGRHTPLGQWGWRLLARKGQRNTAVAAIARKLLVQVWHLLMGNPPTALEADQSLTIKLQKLAVTLGCKLREKLNLPASLQSCIDELRRRILAPPQPG
jgi:transposase